MINDFKVVMETILSNAYYLFNFVSDKATYFLYPLYGLVAGFLIYLILKFISRL